MFSQIQGKNEGWDVVIDKIGNTSTLDCHRLKKKITKRLRNKFFKLATILCRHYLKLMCPSLQNNLKYYYIHMNIFTYPEKFETEDQKMKNIWLKHTLCANNT